MPGVDNLLALLLLSEAPSMRPAMFFSDDQVLRDSGAMVALSGLGEGLGVFLSSPPVGGLVGISPLEAGEGGLLLLCVLLLLWLLLLLKFSASLLGRVGERAVVVMLSLVAPLPGRVAVN